MMRITLGSSYIPIIPLLQGGGVLLKHKPNKKHLFITVFTPMEPGPSAELSRISGKNKDRQPLSSMLMTRGVDGHKSTLYTYIHMHIYIYV